MFGLMAEQEKTCVRCGRRGVRGFSTRLAGRLNDPILQNICSNDRACIRRQWAGGMHGHKVVSDG